MQYKNSQTGWIMIGLFSLISIQITVSFLRFGTNHLPLGVFIGLLALTIAVILTFFRLTIKADEKCIHVIFGIGLMHIKICPETVSEVKVVKTPWYYGLGIRITPRGMLYNVHGSKAVQITYKDVRSSDGKHKTVIIGTNDPEPLKDFIQKRYPVQG